MRWKDKPEVKKGDIGEDIIQEYLEVKGWKVYRPLTSGAHWFDMLASKDKKDIIALDVKTKARFNYRPCTGINKRSYLEYENLLNNIKIPFYLFFVDDKDGNVHFADLSELKGKGFTPPNCEHIIAWDLSDMKYLFNIGKEKIDLLSIYDKRNHKYSPKI